MINKVILLGNVGRDPEVRYTASGKSVVSMSLATTRKYQKGEEWAEETEWHRITVFGKLAEVVGEYVTKGKQLYVEGRIRTTSYEKGGETKYATDVVAEVIKFLGGGGERQDRPAPRRGPSGPTKPAKAQAEEQKALDEDDIPF